jgi:hypothetical protein
MTRIDAMLCRRARRVPDPAVRGFAPGADFVIVAIPFAVRRKQRFEICVSEH